MSDLRYLYDRAKALNDDLKTRRPDLIWIVKGGGLVLEDDPDWSEAHARRLASKREEQRQEFLRRDVLPLDGSENWQCPKKNSLSEP